MAEAPRGGVMFYRQPEPLSPAQHGNLRVRVPAKPYGFAMGEASVPLLITEFLSAANSYPIIFVGPEHVPMAAVGLPASGNLFIMEDGKYDAEVYVPAFLRRYPFVPAASGENADTMVACLDVAADHVSQTDGEPLFERGKTTPFMMNAVNFLDEFETGRRATMQVTQMYAEMDLFEDKQFEIGVGGAERKPVFGFQGLSEDKLAALGPDQVQTLYKSGALAAAYAHVISLKNWTRIVVKAAKKGPVV